MSEENTKTKESGYVFSKKVKAGKRIYYFDVRNFKTKDDFFVTITESKKVKADNFTEENPQFNFIKQKIALYQEDFENFYSALKDVIHFIDEAKGNSATTMSDSKDFDETIISEDITISKLQNFQTELDDIKFDF